MPVPGIFDEKTIVRGRVVGFVPPPSPPPRRGGQANPAASGAASGKTKVDILAPFVSPEDLGNGGPAAAAAAPAWVYEVLFLDGPYADDEEPDGTVRLTLDAKVKCQHYGCAEG